MQIVAFDAGGFSHDEPALDRTILGLARCARPAVAFLPTASSDPEQYVSRFYAAFAQLDCVPSHLSLPFEGEDLEAFILQKDVIYVGGGSARELVALWEAHGLVEPLRAAWYAGTVLAGISAGAVCWFEQALTSHEGELVPMKGLGFLPGSCCVHYDSDPRRRAAFSDRIAQGRLSDGIALAGGAAVHFCGTRAFRLLEPSSVSRAYLVRRVSPGRTEEARLSLPDAPA